MTVNKESPIIFEKALEEASQNPEAPQPLCVKKAGNPNRYLDWSSDPDDEEPLPTPSLLQARRLCEGCPLEDLCTQAALAKRPYHGVRGNGLRYENGRRIR